eukprot:Selendium_serpulae@DN396_c0_g1_i1.p1
MTNHPRSRQTGMPRRDRRSFEEERRSDEGRPSVGRSVGRRDGHSGISTARLPLGGSGSQSSVTDWLTERRLTGRQAGAFAAASHCVCPLGGRQSSIAIRSVSQSVGLRNTEAVLRSDGEEVRSSID